MVFSKKTKFKHIYNLLKYKEKKYFSENSGLSTELSVLIGKEIKQRRI